MPAQYQFLLYYQYVDLTSTAAAVGQSLQDLVASQSSLCEDLQLKGRVRISGEGINGTLSGLRENILEYTRVLDADTVISPPGSAPIHWKLSECPDDDESKLFQSLSIKITKEVVSLDLHSAEETDTIKAMRGGIHLMPRDWHEALMGFASTQESLAPSPLLQAAETNGTNGTNGAEIDPDIVLIDVRNRYETRIGRFELPEGSRVRILDPDTRNVSQRIADTFRLPSFILSDILLLTSTSFLIIELSVAFVAGVYGLYSTATLLST
jgi:predicted sulfurtransferase